jgi:hypothetical protein
LNEIESGYESEIHASTLLRLALALATSPNGLLGYSPYPTDVSGIVSELLDATAAPGSVRDFVALVRKPAV